MTWKPFTSVPVSKIRPGMQISMFQKPARKSSAFTITRVYKNPEGRWQLDVVGYGNAKYTWSADVCEEDWISDPPLCPKGAL